MTAPTVSAIIPSYNKGSTIRAAMESVRRQTFRDVEILVVDDGSTDDTQEQVVGYGHGVRYIRQAQAGVSAARNHGVRASRGEYVAFLDGDDLWLPQKLERQLQVLHEEPRLDAVQCSVYLVNDQLEVVEARRCDSSQDTLLDFLLFRNLPGVGSALLARKRRLESLGGFGEDLVILEDWDVACRFARTNSLRSLPEFLVLYRQHEGNRSRVVKIHVEPGFLSLGRLFADPELDPAIRAQEAKIWARFYSMLAGGYIQNRQWREGLHWAWRALRTCPSVTSYMAGLPVRRLQRLMTSRQGCSFTEDLSFGVGRRQAKGCLEGATCESEPSTMVARSSSR